MAPHSSTLAWKIPWTEDPGGPLSMGSLRVGHDWATSISLFTFMHWSRKWQPTPVQYSCLENPRDGGAWWAAVYGFTQSQTRLKRLSSSSNSSILLAKLYCPCLFYPFELTFHHMFISHWKVSLGGSWFKNRLWSKKSELLVWMRSEETLKRSRNSSEEEVVHHHPGHTAVSKDTGLSG